MAVTDDTKRLSPDLPTSFRNLVPDAGSHFPGSIDQLSGESNDFRNDKFCNGTGIREGGVKDGYTVSCGMQEVDLIGADAEAPNC